MANYSDIPPYARVWIYQSTRSLSERETRQIRKEFKELFTNWNKKVKDLPAFVKIYYDLFVVLMLDEDMAENKKIKVEESLDLLHKFEKEMGLNLFDRLSIAYRDKQNDIQIADHQTFKEMLESGAVNQNTIVFNNLVASKEKFETEWETPFEKSLLVEMIGE